MSLSKITTKELAAKEIEKHMEKGGGYTHNLIAMVLSKVEKDISYEAALELIEEYDLTAIYGIRPSYG